MHIGKASKRDTSSKEKKMKGLLQEKKIAAVFKNLISSEP